MRIRIIGVLLLISLLLPILCYAEPVAEELLIVLLANDGFKSEGGVFSASLEVLVRTAEMQGRNVTIYGADQNDSCAVYYKTGDVFSDRLLEEIDYTDNNSTIRNVITGLNAETVSGKDILLLVGQLHEREASLLEDEALWMTDANSVRAISITQNHRANGNNQSQNAPLSSILITRNLFQAEKNVTQQGSWRILGERFAVREYDKDETMTKRLLSALETDAVFAEEMLDGTDVLIIPELMESVVLAVTFNPGEVVSLVAPDGERWTLSASMQEVTDETLLPDLTSDEEETTEVPETVATPSLSMIPKTPAEIENNLFSAVVHSDRPEVLVFFKNEAYGEWSITTEQGTTNVCLYYLPENVGITAPYVKVVNQEVPEGQKIGSEDEQQVFSLGAGFAKNTEYGLVLNEADNVISVLQERYGSNLRIHAASDTGEVQIADDEMKISSNRADTFQFDVALYLYQHMLGAQRYSVTVENAIPQVVGDVPADVQDRYWDIEFEENKIGFSLDDLMSDPDGETLSWLVAPSESGTYGSRADVNGLQLEIKANLLDITWPEELYPQGEYNFMLRAEDEDHGVCERKITLSVRSMKRELDALRLAVVSPASFSEKRAKGSKEKLRIQWNAEDGLARQETIDYLTQYADVRIGFGGQQTTWQLADWHDQNGSYEAEIEYPRQTNAYEIVAHVSTRSEAPVSFEKMFAVGIAAVDNTAPKITKQGKSAWKLHLNLQQAIEVFAPEAFEDADGDQLKYIVTVKKCTPFTEQEILPAENAFKLPYSFMPREFGVWVVEVKANDAADLGGREGLESESLSLTCIVVPWYIAAMTGVLVLLLLLAIALIIGNCIKPVFPKDSQLTAIFHYQGNETEVSMCPERWKRDALPLDRLLVYGESLLLTREICEQLGKVLIRPHRKGFVLVDKTSGRIARDAKGRTDFDQRVYFDVEEFNVTLSLHSPYDE